MLEYLDNVDLARHKLLDVVFGRAPLGDDLDGDVALMALRVG